MKRQISGVAQAHPAMPVVKKFHAGIMNPGETTLQMTDFTGNTEDKKFICDRMLGKLAKWLRIFGYDCTFIPPGTGIDPLREAETENRFFLTRDRSFIKRLKRADSIPRCLFIEHDNVQDQLDQLRSALKLNLESPGLNRCLRCNEKIVSITKDDARKSGQAPEYVLTNHSEFKRCPQCKKIYWKGSHFQRMKDFARIIDANSC